MRGSLRPSLLWCEFPRCRDERWQGTKLCAGWFGAQASLAARPALVFHSGAARTKGGGWFFASPGGAHTRTHQQREMEREKGRASGRDRARGVREEEGIGKADQD